MNYEQADPIYRALRAETESLRVRANRPLVNHPWRPLVIGILAAVVLCALVALWVIR